MSQENVESVYGVAEAFNRRDLDAFLAFCDPAIELHYRLAELEGGRPYRGHAALRSWWESLFALSPDFSTEIEGVKDTGGATVVHVRQRGHGVQSDAPMDQTYWMVAKWRDRRSLRIYLSEAEALEAVGLSE
jgi:ketosteroid isomerase-like protein